MSYIIPEISNIAYERWDEWRVTGIDEDGTPYEYIWSQERNPDTDSQAGARKFFNMIMIHHHWTDGPHLSKRTIIRTDWVKIL